MSSTSEPNTHKQSPQIISPTPTFNRDRYRYKLTPYKHKTMATYTISHLAYIKVALHAAKYPHRQVNGVLPGNASADRTQVGTIVDSCSRCIQRAFPSLSFPLEDTHTSDEGLTTYISDGQTEQS